MPISQTAVDDPEAIAKEQELNNSEGWLLRHAFYGQFIGDILKTISGGATVGAFTLGMCGIAAFAELEFVNKNQGVLEHDGTVSGAMPKNDELFTKWVYTWLNEEKLDEPYDSMKLYAIRCALAHSYGWAKKLRNAEIDGYLLSREQSAFHCDLKHTKDDKWIYRLNLENFIADIIFAFDDCFQHLVPGEKDSGFLNYVKALIAPKKLNASEQFVVVDTARISMDFFDNRLIKTPLQIAKLEVIEKIRTLGTAKNNI